MLTFDPVQQIKSCAIGQAHVGDDSAVTASLQAGQRFSDRSGRLQFIALAQQGQFIQSAQIWFVINDQQTENGLSGHALFWATSGGSLALEIQGDAARR